MVHGPFLEFCALPLACEVCTCSCMHIFWVRTMRHIIACFILLYTKLLCPLEWRGYSNSNSVYCLLHNPCFSVYLMTRDKKYVKMAFLSSRIWQGHVERTPQRSWCTRPLPPPRISHAPAAAASGLSRARRSLRCPLAASGKPDNTCSPYLTTR